MKRLLLASVIFSGLPIAAQAQTDRSDQPIVVTGQRPADSLRLLKECLAQGCPPERDIELSLAHAENLFVAGDYRDGQKTLRGSIKRTDDAAERLPVPVAGLYRASARFAEHLGEGKDFQLSTLDMRDTLKDGLGKDHWRTLAADLTVGDSRAKLGIPDDAERIYKRTEKRAIELGQPRVAMLARVRQALLYGARFDTEKRDHWQEKQIELLSDIRDNPLEGGEEFSFIAEVMLAKMDRKDGDGSSTEDLIRRYAESGGADRPVLLFSEPLYSDADLDREAARSQNATARLSASSFAEPQWADIGFWIGPDGKVSDFDVLRAEGPTGWLEQVKRHVTSRRYAPLSEDRQLDGFYQIERYTYTARFADQTTGTRLRTREPVKRIERLDITPENYDPQASGT